MFFTHWKKERSLPHWILYLPIAGLGDLHLFIYFFSIMELESTCVETPNRSEDSMSSMRCLMWGLLWRPDVFVLPVFWMMGREAKGNFRNWRMAFSTNSVTRSLLDLSSESFCALWNHPHYIECWFGCFSHKNSWCKPFFSPQKNL